MRTICIILFVLCTHIAFSQKAKTYFPDNRINNMILFTSVNDTLIAVRAIPEGIQWNLYDSNLQLISSKLSPGKIPADILMDQLKPLSNALGFVKQKIVADHFEVWVRSMQASEAGIPNDARLIYSERIIDSVTENLYFSFTSSPDRKHHLLYKQIPATASDSIRLRVIALNERLEKNWARTITLPLSATESLLTVATDDAGDAYTIIGNQFAEFVLGTKLRVNYLDDIGKPIQIALQRKKVQNILVSSNAAGITLYCTTSPSNVDRDINSISVMHLQKNKDAVIIEEKQVDAQTLAAIARIVAKKTPGLLNTNSWSMYDSVSSNVFAVMNIQAGLRPAEGGPYVHNNLPLPADRDYRTADVRKLYREELERERIDDIMERNAQYTGRYVKPLKDIERAYKELPIMLTTGKQLDVFALHHDAFTPGLQFAKWVYRSGNAVKLIGVTKPGGDLQLATAVVKDQHLTDAKLLAGTENIVIDGSIQPLRAGNKMYILFINTKTMSNGILRVE